MKTTLLCLIAYSLAIGINGDCTASSAQEFVEINEDDYDRTYYSIASTGDPRPLGFERAVVPFNDPDRDNPCVSIAGDTDGRHIEIQFETVPSQTLCMRDNTGREVCSSGRHQECLDARSAAMHYEFYCDVAQGCSESDVNFWYRITRGPPKEEDNEGMWCQWRENEFPEDLLQLPPEIDPPAPTERPINHATAPSGGSAAILTAISAVIMLIIRS